MKVSAAYLGIILIWATTPLTVKWSGESSGFLLALIVRISIGLVCIAVAMALSGVRWVWDRTAVLTYLSGTVGVFGAMVCVYWSAQLIPSGWISVIFGFTPIVTAFMAGWLLNEQALSPGRLGALLVAVAGLALMYFVAADFGEAAIAGIAGVLLSTWLHSLSAVLIKRIGADLSALASTAGSLLCSLPLLLLLWCLSDQAWPERIPFRSMMSIVYTGVVATAIGFSLYYFVLQRLSAVRVSLIALFSPILALWLGNLLNQEPLNARILLGSGLILLSLFLFEITAPDKRCCDNEVE